MLFRVLYQWWKRRQARAAGLPDPEPTGPSSVTLGARAMELELANVVAIARREYVTRGRTRVFRIVTVVLVLVALGVSLAPVLIQWVDKSTGSTLVEVEVGDTKPALPADATIAAILNAEAGTTAAVTGGGSNSTTGTPGAAPPYAVTTTTDDVSARARVESGASAGLLILSRDPTTHVLGFTFVTKAKAIDRISQFMAGAATELAHLDLLAQSGIPPATQALLGQPPAYAAQLPNGQPVDTSPAGFVNQFATGFILSIVLFMAIIIYGQWVALSVAEEKSSRVMEIILGAASPFELLTGKVIGVGGLALTQYVIIFIPALIGLLFQSQLSALILGGSAGSVSLPQGLSIGLLLVFGLVFLLGFTFYAVLYAGAASLISRTEDVQNIVAPMSLVASAGYLVAVYSTTGLIPSDSKLIDIATYVPFFSPVMILTRIGAGTIGTGQAVVALAILAIAVPVALWVAARFYAAGVLMYGQRPGIALLMRVLRGG